MSDPDLNHAREALAHLEHLVVQDLFLTETAVYADVVLPASAWPEKDGTVTNTNRQVQMGRQALPLPGEAKWDWWIIQEIGRRIGLPWNYQHPSEIYTEMAALMPSLDNISWERVARESAVTYPADAPDQPGHDVVFDKGFPRPGGFGKLVAAKLTPPDETPERGISVHPHHRPPARALAHRRHDAARQRRSTRSSPARSPRSRAARIARLGIEPGDMMRVSTRRGVIELAARQDDAIPDGVVFIPFAYRGGGRQPAHQSGARSVRQDPRVQVLRRQGREGGGGGARWRRSDDERSCRASVPFAVRHDWTRAEVRALFELPFPDLMFQAQSVHRVHFDPRAVQISTLLSIKTGGCPEDCAYCPQSAQLRDRRRGRKAHEPRRGAGRGAGRQGRRRQPLLHGGGLALAQGPRSRPGLRHGGGRQGARARDLRDARHAHAAAGAAPQDRRASTTTTTISTPRRNITTRSSPPAPIRIASTRSPMCATPASRSAAAASSAWARARRTASA